MHNYNKEFLQYADKLLICLQSYECKLIYNKAIKLTILLNYLLTLWLLVLLNLALLPNILCESCGLHNG